MDVNFDRWHAAVPPDGCDGAKIEPMPAAALRFKDPKKQLMVAILFQLQLAAGNKPIFLPVLKAEKLLGVPARTCTYCLSGLVARGLLEIVLEADRIRQRATRYRFVAMAEKEKS
jgi:hypothetical protein